MGAMEVNPYRASTEGRSSTPVVRKNRWVVLAALSFLPFIGAVVSFFNLWAAIDLGFDATPEGKSLIEAAQFATPAAAISVTRIGAQTSAPTRQEIVRFLRSRMGGI